MNSMVLARLVHLRSILSCLSFRREWEEFVMILQSGCCRFGKVKASSSDENHDKDEQTDRILGHHDFPSSMPQIWYLPSGFAQINFEFPFDVFCRTGDGGEVMLTNEAVVAYEIRVSSQSVPLFLNRISQAGFKIVWKTMVEAEYQGHQMEWRELRILWFSHFILLCSVSSKDNCWWIREPMTIGSQKSKVISCQSSVIFHAEGDMCNEQRWALLMSISWILVLNSTHGRTHVSEYESDVEAKFTQVSECEYGWYAEVREYEYE